MTPTSEAVATIAPRLTTPRSAGVAGVLFAVLFGSALLVMRESVSLSASGLAEGFSEGLRTSASLAALYLIPFAGIAFLWFIGVVRDRVGEHEDRFFATVFLGAGLLFIAMMFGASSIIAAMLTLERPTPATADLARSIARAMLYIYGARSAGVFTLVTSTIILRTGVAPRWIALLGFATGLTLLLSVQYFDLIILLFPSWVAILSILVLIHARKT